MLAKYTRMVKYKIYMIAIVKLICSDKKLFIRKIKIVVKDLE